MGGRDGKEQGEANGGKGLICNALSNKEFLKRKKNSCWKWEMEMSKAVA